MNNVYLVYSETKQDRYSNGKVIQCDTLQELIFELQRCIRENSQNIVILTIQNGKPQ